MTWAQFIAHLHEVVNPLAGDEHLKEVIQQLQLMGEVVYLKSESADLICLCPQWLCSTLCGQVLSRYRQLWFYLGSEILYSLVGPYITISVFTLCLSVHLLNLSESLPE